MIMTAAVPYMNGRPLVWGLGREPGMDGFYAVPTQIAELLVKEEIAAGLVSIVACFANPRLEIVPGISISCNGHAESVKFFYDGELGSIRKVALDTSSLTSVMLARIILQERYGLSPEFVSMHPSVSDMLAACDGAVVIGDTTMLVPSGRSSELDLGSEWHAMTGLPFVFAVWAVNPHMASAELVDALERSKAFGLSHLHDVANAESGRLGIPEEVCYRYLSEIMDYDLTDRHMEAISLFREKARQHGFIAGDHELKLYEPAERIAPV